MEKFVKYFDLLTVAEKRVCNYVFEHSYEVINMNINDLAEKTFTSKTVVINMAKRLGFEGYSDLKYYLKSLKEKGKKNKEAVDIFSIIELCKSLLNNDLLLKAAKSIKNATTVYIAARGTSKTCSMYLSRLLVISGINCILIDDYNLLSIVANKVEKKELFILISLSGETAKIIECAKIVKARQSKIISITSFSNNTLQKLSDINLFVSSDSVDTLEDDDKSRIGMFITIELLVNRLKETLT